MVKSFLYTVLFVGLVACFVGVVHLIVQYVGVRAYFLIMSVAIFGVFWAAIHASLNRKTATDTGE